VNIVFEADSKYTVFSYVRVQLRESVCFTVTINVEYRQQTFRSSQTVCANKDFYSLQIDLERLPAIMLRIGIDLLPVIRV
jgi:hypothetical protein